MKNPESTTPKELVESLLSFEEFISKFEQFPTYARELRELFRPEEKGQIQLLGKSGQELVKEAIEANFRKDGSRTRIRTSRDFVRGLRNRTV